MAVPISELEQPIFDALTDQIFTLHVDFINTVTSCASVSIAAVIEGLAVSVSDMICTETNGTISIRAKLPQHAITVQAILENIQLVGGVRVGLSGHGQETKLCTLRELNFNQVFVSASGGTLAQQATIHLTVARVSVLF